MKPSDSHYQHYRSEEIANTLGHTESLLRHEEEGGAHGSHEESRDESEIIRFAILQQIDGDSP